MENPQFNYKMVIAYDGTRYSGWQIQPNGTSIQELIQKAIHVLLKDAVNVVGSGRTDAGVHALGQTAHFKCSTEIDLYRFFGGLNALLPRDIRIKKLEAAAPDFHAQYSAISKTYHYHLHLDRVENPFNRLYRMHVLEKIDIHLLKEASAAFLGTHDFSSFANEAHKGTASHDPIRTLQRLDVVEQEGGVRLEFQADGFLYKMVRNIVGTLLEVSASKRPIDDIGRLLKARDRRLAGPAAQPQGLFLMQVDYK